MFQILHKIYQDYIPLFKILTVVSDFSRFLFQFIKTNLINQNISVLNFSRFHIQFIKSISHYTRFFPIVSEFSRFLLHFRRFFTVDSKFSIYIVQFIEITSPFKAFKCKIRIFTFVDNFLH